MKNKIIPFLCSMMLLVGCSNAVSEPAPEAPKASQDPISSEQAPAPSVEKNEQPAEIIMEPEVEVAPSVEQEPEIQKTPGYVKVEPLELVVRTSEATITDSGRVNQKMDIVYLDYDYPALKALGYIYLDINITFEAREVYDGYQYLFLYNTSKCQSSAESLAENFVPAAGDGLNQGMLIKEQFEIGPGERKTSWEERHFHYVISTDYMIDDLYLRYGANGILEDTWVNRNVRVTVEPKLTKN